MCIRENSNDRNKQTCEILLFNHYKSYISITTMAIANKHGRVVTYCEKVPSTKSHEPLIMWPCEIT